MTIIVRCIFRKAVTPTCDVLYLSYDEWRAFFSASPQERKRMVLTKLHKIYLLGATKEMVWIPYDGQDIIQIKNEI